MNILIPKGFKKIAVSEERNVSVETHFHPDRKLFFTVVSVKKTEDETESFSLGPYSVNIMPMLIHCISDVFNMRGKYTFLP